MFVNVSLFQMQLSSGSSCVLMFEISLFVSRLRLDGKRLEGLAYVKMHLAASSAVPNDTN